MTNDWKFKPWNSIEFTGGHTVTWQGAKVAVRDDSGDEAVVDSSAPIRITFGGGCIGVPSTDGYPIGGVTIEEALFIASKTGQRIIGDHGSFSVAVARG